MLKHRLFNFLFSFFFLTLLISSTANAATTAPASASTTTLTPVGQVIITEGTVTDMDINKHIRPIARGDKFYNGDTLITAAESKVQVRYTDGTVLALDADTQFKVTNYHYQEANQPDKNFAVLIKGGFRALTGLISKNNPAAYQVDTTVAAIAVRGTSFGASYRNGKLFIGVWKGLIVIENSAGSLLLGANQNYDYAVVTAADSSPVGLLSQPNELAGHCLETPG